MEIIIPSKQIYSKDLSVSTSQTKTVEQPIKDIKIGTTTKSFEKRNITGFDTVNFPRQDLETIYKLSVFPTYQYEFTDNTTAYFSWCAVQSYYKEVEFKIKKTENNQSLDPKTISITKNYNAVKRQYNDISGSFSVRPDTSGAGLHLVDTVTLDYNFLKKKNLDESVTNIPLEYYAPNFSDVVYGKSVSLKEPIEYTDFDENYYNIKINILHAVSVITLYADTEFKYVYATYQLGGGTLEEYRAFSIDVELLGECYTLNIADDTVSASYGADGTDIILSSNNFMQSKYKEDYQGKVDSLLQQYKNGKSTATLLCAIGEYYDNSGNKVISTKNAEKMHFDLYDVVVPMKKNQYGNDSPLLLSDNAYGYGKPRSFKVLEVEPYFDGAVWQKLNLQEFANADYTSNNGTRELLYRFMHFSDDKPYYVLDNYGYTTEKNIVIASNINGYPVKEITVQMYNPDLIIDAESLTIPNTITELNRIGSISVRKIIFESNSILESIGERAFYYVQNLLELKIPNSVIYIGYSAFEECPHLTSVTLPNKLEAIGNNLFYNCVNLKNVKMPKSVRWISQNAFAGCFNLTDVYYEGTAPDWYSVEIEGGNEALQQATIHFNSEFYE